ncbi:hypothetical protein os1_37600 [Comamonadaceae bacterium OS-1]|nr:hypothetical protein os1_37600 [Comamonadaceae bacterium OS-1]
MDDTALDCSAPAPAPVLTPIPAASPSLAALVAASTLVACGGGSGSDTGTGASTGTSSTSTGTSTSSGGTSTGTGTSTGASTDTGTSTSSGGTNTNTSSGDSGSVSNPTPAPLSDTQAARFLLQAQLSASDAEIAAVRASGTAAWLATQYATAPGPTGWDWLDSRGYDSISTSTRFYDTSYPGDYMVWKQLMTAPDGMRQRMALALSEVFVVSLTGLGLFWSPYAMASYWDLLAAQAFGNFRSLLEAVTLNPAMGVYLNTCGNQKENPSTGRQPDENYAREVMQLMTIGLVQLNPDGSPKKDTNGKDIPTYSQSDVSHLARVFTGYDLDQSQNVVTVLPGTGGRTMGNNAYARKPMVQIAGRHSNLAATFLGVTVAANTGAATALKTALDTLFNHPNVGPFFGRQMIQRLVTSNPSAAYVARVAAAFNHNAAGVRGDLQAVWSAILLDEEARGDAGLTAPGFGKLREPMLRLVQWGRTFGITSARGTWKIGELTDPASQLGQSPLRSPSVFNFFRPGYVPPGTPLAANGSVAPEFQLVNESSVGGYLNYLQVVVRKGIYVQAPEQSQDTSNSATNGYDITARYTAELALATDANALVARLNLLLCAGQLSAATQTLVVNALNATPVTASSSDSVRRDRVAAAVLLVMASSEYLVQK